jgi:tetratricopeptide (TPR) repeat protein
MRHWLRVATHVAVLTTSIFGGFGTLRAARADGASTTEAQRDSRSLDLFEKSAAAYDSGRFADAITLLQQAYELKKEPVLLYNMGRAYEGLGELAFAAQAYESFLQGQPSAPDRGALERRIATLRRQVAEKEALRKRALERDRTSPPGAGGGGGSAMPWVIVGLGAAGLATGGVLGLLASQRNLDAKSEPTYVRADRLHTQAEALARGANYCLIGGGVVVIAGIIWAIFDTSGQKPKRRTGELPAGMTFAF